MTYFPPLFSSPPLWSTLQQVLEPPAAGPVWFDGPESIARRLVLQGYQLTRTPENVRAVLWIRKLPSGAAEASALLGHARDSLVPGGRVIVVEPSIQTGFRISWFGRLGIRLGWFHPPERLSRWFLAARLTPVVQRWPQGLRAWVVTCAQPGSPYAHLFPGDG